jgi:hypothetical protein
MRNLVSATERDRPLQSALVCESLHSQRRGRAQFQRHPNRIGLQPCPAIVAVCSLDNRLRRRLIEFAGTLGI